jgi:hypothetical protein
MLTVRIAALGNTSQNRSHVAPRRLIFPMRSAPLNNDISDPPFGGLTRHAATFTMFDQNLRIIPQAIGLFLMQIKSWRERNPVSGLEPYHGRFYKNRKQSARNDVNLLIMR